ncbi:MAG: hypothetical protein ACQER1_14650 [Armatimonadota bacterium]
MKKATELSERRTGLRRSPAATVTGALRHHARALWWIGAGLPPLVAVGLLLVEPMHPPAVASTFDLSRRLYHISAALTVVVGVLMVIATTRRLGNQLRRVSRNRTSSQRDRLRSAREARLRAAWMLLVGTLLIAVGLVLLIVPEEVLS